MFDHDRMDVDESDLQSQVAAIETMSLKELREFWRAHWAAPPKLRSVQLLRMIVAWRVQAAAEGGLDPDTKGRLRSKAMPRTPPPPVGTRLTREYRGVPYTVEVGDDGFSHAGRTYASLSQVAREITGTLWNGPRFFGLRSGERP